MNKSELIAKLKEKFYRVNDAELHQGKTEKGITVWGIGVFDKVGDVISKNNLTFYTKGGGDLDEAWWGNAEPKQTPVVPPTPPTTFADRINDLIAAKTAAGIIRFGHIEQINETTKRALCTVIIDDEIIKTKFLGLSTTTETTIEVKKAIVTETESGFTFFVF